MNMQKWVRQGHRWLGIILTLTILVNFGAMAVGTPPMLVVYAPLVPLALLIVTGLSMFVLPYRTRYDVRSRS